MSDDALWPRAGGWEPWDRLPAEADVDLALLGVPAWRTSLSPTGAHATPGAVRDALRRYSPALLPDRSSTSNLPTGPGRTAGPRTTAGPGTTAGPAATTPGLVGVRRAEPVDLGELVCADLGDVGDPDSPE